MDSTQALTGHNLKVRRVDARVKAKDLAAHMGVSGSRLSTIEREGYPSSEIVARYLSALAQCQNVPNVGAA